MAGKWFSLGAEGGRGIKTLLQAHHKTEERFPSPRETFQHLATKILRYTLITKHIQLCDGIQIQQFCFKCNKNSVPFCIVKEKSILRASDIKLILDTNYCTTENVAVLYFFQGNHLGSNCNTTQNRGTEDRIHIYTSGRYDEATWQNYIQTPFSKVCHFR